MASKKRYLDTDVLTMARERIRHTYDIFDHVAVSWSGGKDSTVCLYLVEEIRRERGIKTPLHVIFRDEELIPDDVLDFVNKKRLLGIYDFRYYAVAQKSQKYVLGNLADYVQWDPRRAWIRPKPEFAITGDPQKIYHQTEMDAFLAQGVRGRMALILGIRADESITRYKSVMQRRFENYICASSAPNVRVVKPIYDWAMNDIFKYYLDTGQEYCVTYDLQAWNAQPLRVATPLLAESSKTFHKLRTLYPVFYNQIVSMFPDMILQERYSRVLSRDIAAGYPHTWDGLRQFVQERFSPFEAAKIRKHINSAQAIRRNKEAQGDVRGNLGGYPLRHVWRTAFAGSKYMIQPKAKPTKDDLEFEGRA